MDCLLLSWVLCTLNLYWNFKIFSHCHLLLIILLDRRQWGPIRSVLLVITGWLVGNAAFSETALRIFLIFCMKLGDYEGRKVPDPDFWKKILIWRYSQKGRQISPRSDTLIFFSKTAVQFFWFLAFNFNEAYFSEKCAIWRYLPLKSSKNCPNWSFWLFYRLCILSFPWFCT